MPRRGKRATSREGRIWMFSFESSDVAVAGGLGPAVTNLARALARSREVTIFMPSHGRHADPDIRKRLGLRPVDSFVSSGNRRGADGKLFPYRIGLEEGEFGGIRYVLATGLEQETRRWLDSGQIYDGDATYEKMALFARAMRSYADSSERPPEVIHAHDWNVIPAAVAARQAFEERHKRTALVYTIHLLGYKGFPWHYASADWCGVRDEPQELLLDGEVRRLTTRQAWDDLAGGKVERFGGIEADYVTTVSETYLKDDVLPFLGPLVVPKSGFIYNGCDWDGKAMTKEVIMANPELRANPRVTRAEMRRYLLTKALSIPQDSQRPGERVDAFGSDGELVIATGRLDKQKGVDVLLEAIPEVVEALPSSRFLLMMLPQPHGGLVEPTVEAVERLKENVRLLLGRAHVYRLAYVSADVYAMPSRWEPFGMTALEAMATGNPVVGSRVGGIQETVLDVASHGGSATGILVAKEDSRELARGLISMLIVMRLAEDRGMLSSPEKQRLIDSVPMDEVRQLIVSDIAIGREIRGNCVRRVKEKFGVDAAAKMALEAYHDASHGKLKS